MERKKELIRLRDVSRFYEMGDSVVKALNKINFKVYEGEFVAIMGPSGSGKCVVGETEVIGRDGVPRKIEDFGEKALFSYDFNSGRVSPSKISGYHKRDESELIEIRTRGGRRIVVTEDHPFFSLDGGGVCKVFASNLKEGGFVACPRKIKFAGGSQKLDSFEKLSDDKSLVIYDSVNLVRRVFDKIGVSRAHVCKKLNINPGTYDCWKTKNNIPLKIFADILNLYGKNIGDYDKLLLTGRGSPKRIRVPVLTGPSLMEFYGYLAGDGNLDRDGVKFTNFDKELIDRFVELSREVFMIEPTIRIGRIDVSSRVLVSYFEKVFNFSRVKKSRNVSLPDFVFRCKENEVAAFVRGLFDCDSHVSLKKKEIEITLASEKLVRQLIYLLQRFGIVSKYSEKEKFAANTKLKIRRKYYSLSVSGYDSLKLYDKFIGFNSLKKARRLKKHLGDDYNTNVDVVPCGDLIRKIRRDSGIVFSRATHKLLWSYETKNINPSIRKLGKIIGIFKKGGVKRNSLRELRELYNADIFWDRIVSIKKVRKNVKVYDLTVPGVSNFIASNFIVHNSTAMNLVGSLDVPTHGTIYLDGGDISELHESDLAQIRGKKIGFIFQSFNLIPNLTAKENVMLPMMFQGMDIEDRGERAEELLALVDLNDRMEHYPGELSGGQRQRVAIARSLANDPEVILADEPTGNLDSKTGATVMEFLEKMNQKGKTIIMVTHDADLAKAHADVVYWLLDGELDRVTKGGNSVYKRARKKGK